MVFFSLEAGVEQVARRCQVSGTRLALEEVDPDYEPGAVIPDGAWRDLDPLHARLLCTERDVRRAVRIVSAADVPGTAPFAKDATYLGTVTSGADALTTTINNASGQRLGLHVDNWDRLTCRHRVESRLRLCINLGPAPRWLLVGDIDGVAICSELYPREYADRTPHTDDVRAFVKNGHALGCLRIRLEPGEGYIAPTELMVHDGSTAGTAGPSEAAFWLGHIPQGAFQPVW
ncbi:hypothetical protein ACFXDE_01875 [Kitasatospora sp. NPDC059408]|uniref:hypothetical protein n=1 Tax=Kitasatospora sp. NPDC059408 TaxID=3346823 RepID=UPI0036ABD475